MDALCHHRGRLPFVPGFTVTDLVRDETGLAIRGHGAEGEREIRGDFVVGTDGRASIVRKRAGLAIDRSSEMAPGNADAMWSLMPLPGWLEHDMVFYGFGACRGAGTMYAAPTGGLRIGWMVPKGSRREFRNCDPVEEVARHAPPFVADFLRSHRKEASRPVYFNVLFGRCRSWSAPGVLLLGDAAHPMNPVRAQGINLGLRDALVAANHLVPVLEAGAPGGEVDAAAARIQPEREEEVRVAQRAQLRGMMPPPVFARPWFRNRVLPVLVRCGIPRRAFQRMDRPLRYGVRPVRLSV